MPQSSVLKKAPIIALVGYRGSGKSHCAVVIQDKSCFDQNVSTYRRVSFADPLRAAASAIWGWRAEDYAQGNKEVVSERWGISPRQSLIEVGMWCRNRRLSHWLDRFLDKVENLAPRFSTVCDDVRYLNEAEAIIDAGGMLVWIDGPGTPAPEDEPELEDIRALCAFELENVPGTTTKEQIYAALVYPQIPGE